MAATSTTTLIRLTLRRLSCATRRRRTASDWPARWVDQPDLVLLYKGCAWPARWWVLYKVSSFFVQQPGRPRKAGFEQRMQPGLGKGCNGSQVRPHAYQLKNCTGAHTTSRAAMTHAQLKPPLLPLLQSWAQSHGGVRAALARPDAPPEGPLRDALSAVLRQHPPTSVAHDLG